MSTASDSFALESDCSPACISTHGPDPITSRESPMTSDSTSTTIRPARHARASPPAFTRLIERRTWFSSSMFAPDFERKSVKTIFSSSEIVSRGATIIAEAPPLSTTKTRSFTLSDFTNSSMSDVDCIALIVGEFDPCKRTSAFLTCVRISGIPSGTFTMPMAL